MQRILFVDPDHGARSQMAEAIFRRAVNLSRGAGASRYHVASAGTDPVGSLDAVAEVLREIYIDDFMPTRRALETALDPPPDLLIILCEESCGSCPYVPGARRAARWPQPDPDRVPIEERAAVLRRIRGDLVLRVAALINLPPSMPA